MRLAEGQFGLSWQMAPRALITMLTGPDSERVQRVTNAFLQMKKFDIAALRRAYDGVPQ